MTNIRFNGRPIHNPILRTLAAIVLALGMVLLFIGTILIFALLVVLLPITIPGDLLLKRCGRQGFLRQKGSHLTYAIDLQAFRKATR